MQDDTVACAIYFNSAYNLYFNLLLLLSSASLTGDLSCCFLYGEETNLRYSSNPINQLTTHSSSAGHPQALSGFHQQSCLPATWIHSCIAFFCCCFCCTPQRHKPCPADYVFVSIGLTWEKQILVCSACYWVYQKEDDLGMKMWNVLTCPCQDCVSPSLQSVSD